jgi:threonine dehydratase
MVTAEDVRTATERIGEIARRTPVMTSELFDALADVQAVFKCEMFQRGGSFKVRGASNFLLSMPEADRARGVVAFSSGNHAQGVAIAARRLEMKATIVMPQDAPPVKLAATRAYGAEVITYDRLRESREAIGKRLAEESGATLVPPYDHPWTIAGQGSVAVELLDEVRGLDAIIVPIGGGGLISGCSVWAKSAQPGIRVIGVEPEAANDTFLSLQAGQRVEIPIPDTIADGLRATKPGEITFPIIQQNVDEVILVTDEEIDAAQKFLASRMKIVAEPSGAVTAAAVLFRKLSPNLRRVGVVLSGGNV